MSARELRLVCFSCRFGWGYVADPLELAAILPNWVPLLCSGKVEVETVLKAFREGADGVLIFGCPDGQCHFQDGNSQLLKRLTLLGKLLEQLGIDHRRLRTVFANDPTGGSMAERCAEMLADLRRLPPRQSFEGGRHG